MTRILLIAAVAVLSLGSLSCKKSGGGGPTTTPTGKSVFIKLTLSPAVLPGQDNLSGAVNAVLPGWIETDLTRGARRDVPGLHERVVARTPAGRWGEPSDLAGVAVFLASKASDFVTGTAIPVDGGYSAQV